MKHGRVLAETAEVRERTNRLRNSSGGDRRRVLLGRVFLGSWFSLVVGVSLLITLVPMGETISGLPAFLAMLLLLSIVVSFLVAVLVTSYLVVSWAVGVVRGRHEVPQDSIEATVLHSTSIYPLVYLAAGWLFLSFVCGVALGSAGFLAAIAIGFVVSMFAISTFGVLDQSIEVLPHEVRVRSLKVRIVLPASSITDIELAAMPFMNADANELVIHRTGLEPLRLGDKFVTDVDRAEQFVAEARAILRLDEPSDAPLPPRPQDAAR